MVNRHLFRRLFMLALLLWLYLPIHLFGTGEKPISHTSYFWEPWWVKILGIAIILYLIRLGYLLKTKSARRQKVKLKQVIDDRTESLEKKTMELELRKADLERVDKIVRSINARVEPTEILSAILKETAVMKGVDHASALVYDKSLDAYTFKASSGYTLDSLQDIRLSFNEVEARYSKGSSEIYKDIFVIKDVEGRSGEAKVKSVGLPQSMLMLKIRGETENQVAGYLIFDNMTDPDAFHKEDVGLLEKLKVHITSAFIKSKLLLELGIEREAAESANTAKSMFLARMSHEIRTPMNSVIGFADILNNTPLNDEQKEFLRNITRSGEALLHLIDEILDFSKIEAGRLSIQPIDFDPEVTVFEVCRSMQPRVENTPVEILCRIGDNVPAYVKSDAARIRQVLINLMGNAVKFTHKGMIELSLIVEEEEEDQLKLHMAVQDTGIGITRDQMDSIFEAFQQADGSITRKYGGTGLGLAISKQIAILLGGDIRVESQKGKGSTFHFTVKVQKSQKHSTPRTSPQWLYDKKVLLATDNANHLDILNHLVLRARMKPLPVRDCDQLLNMIEEAAQQDDPFDICILDIQMAGLTEGDYVPMIRHHDNPKVSQIPLLGISTPMLNRSKQSHPLKLDGFLPKPIQPQELLSMMQRLLQQPVTIPDSPVTGSPADNTLPGNKTQLIKMDQLVTRHSLAEEAKQSVYILLAEDNALNRKLANYMLTKGGYRVDMVENGKEAVESYTGNPNKYHLILMDINMPEMDGREATKAIREKGFTWVPIIAMTAHAMKEDRESCLKAGMNDYIPKPIKRGIVFNMIEKWVL